MFSRFYIKWVCFIAVYHEKEETDLKDAGSPVLLMMNRACLLERRIFGKKACNQTKGIATLVLPLVEEERMKGIPARWLARHFSPTQPVCT